MVRDYELMYIARPELDEEGLQGAADSVAQLVAGAGGAVVHTTNWGRRRLAYEVDHLRDGHYMLLHIRLDGERVRDVERALAIHETVFRHLLVVREGGDDAEPDALEPPAPAPGDSATEETPAVRQPVVAAGEDDDEDDEAEDDDDDDGEPAALVADSEEEN